MPTLPEVYTPEQDYAMLPNLTLVSDKDLCNSTTDTLEQEISYLRYVLITLFYLPCVFIIFVGNTFVLVAYKRDKRIRENITNAYILNLALADLLVGVVLLIYAQVFYTRRWSFGGLFCIATWVLDYTATYMSTITIIAISVDRYLMVQNSLRHRSGQSHKKVAIICSILWLACLAVHSTLAFTYSASTGFLHAEDRIASCDLGYGKNLVIIVMMFVLGFLAPGICVFSLNLRVYFQLKRRSNNFQTGQSLYQSGSGEVPPEDKPRRTTSCTVHDMRIHGSASGSQHQKAAKFLTLLLIVFVICWSPFYIYHCYAFVRSKGVYSEVIDHVLSLILWMNSAINPFLYAFTNVFFKENFMYFLRCK